MKKKFVSVKFKNKFTKKKRQWGDGDCFKRYFKKFYR